MDRERGMTEYFVLKAGVCLMLVEKSEYIGMVPGIPVATVVQEDVPLESHRRKPAPASQVRFPEFQPHWPVPERKVHWFLDNGFSIRYLMVKLKTRIPDNEIRIAFASHGEVGRTMPFRLKFDEIVGTATNSKKKEFAEFEFSFDVKMYDNSILFKRPPKDVFRFSLYENACLHLSALANHRAAHWRDRFFYREDFLSSINDAAFAPPRGEEWEKKYSESGWVDWLVGRASSNTLRVPLVFYGPVGYDNALAVFSLDVAARGDAETFFSHWSRKWRDFMNSQRMSTGSIMRDIRFDPHATPNRRDDFSSLELEEYSLFSEKNTVQLVVHCLDDARDIYSDTCGIVPFGTRILVLDARSVSSCISFGPKNTMKPKTTPDAKAYLDKVNNLLGELVVVEGTSTTTRYPPFAVVLLDKEQMAMRHTELLVSFVKSHFTISLVFPMLAFTPPTEANEAAYDNATPMNRRIIRDKWEQVARNTIRVLNSIMWFLHLHEIDSWEKYANSERNLNKSLFQRLIEPFTK